MYLGRYFRFYVPGTNDGVLDPLADEVAVFFSERFGGATIREAEVAWQDGNGNVVKEPIAMVQSFAGETDCQRHVGDVHTMAGRIAARTGQQSVTLEDCGGFIRMASAVRQASTAIDDSISPDLPPVLPAGDFLRMESKIDRMESKLDSLLGAAEATTSATADRAVVEPIETATQPPYQFRRCGDCWLARFTTQGGIEEGHFRGLEGCSRIVKLITHPEKPIEAIVLQGLQDSPVAHVAMRPQFASDARTRQEVEERMADLEQQIAEEADPAEKVVLQEEYGKLSAYAKDAKMRRLGPPPAWERARKAVRNAIDRAVDRIRDQMPEFARFLDRSIRAHGTAFVYSPAPPAPQWVLE